MAPMPSNAINHGTDASDADLSPSQRWQAPVLDTKAELEARWRVLLADDTIKSLGASAGFKTLLADCELHGLKPCSSRICRNPILSFSCFSTDASRCDGLQARCKECSSDPAVAKASREHKLAVRALVDSSESRVSGGDTEDEACKWLVCQLRTHNLEACATLEFRHADVAARRATWLMGQYLRMQLKSDGAFKACGRVAKPSGRCHTDGTDGRARFYYCTGYHGLVMIFVKSRFAVDGSITRSIWHCDGCSVTQERLLENADGTLGLDRIARGSIQSLAAAIDVSTLPRMTLEAINLEVAKPDHRKEVTIMLALRAAGYDVCFRPGNQTSVDCLVGGITTQVKTYNLAWGSANAHHNCNGHVNQAYSDNDGIEQLLEGAIVKSGETFWLLHARQPLDALLYNDVFAHAAPYRGKPPSPGKVFISPPLEIFKRWLVGANKSKTQYSRLKWLKNPSFNWRCPVEIVPGKWGIPALWLAEAAQTVACPAAFPSNAVLAELQACIERSDTMLAMAAERRATEAAAERAEVAADRAEAAVASSSGAEPSNVTINVTNNINFNLATAEPPTKRLKQSALSFLPAPL